MLRPIDAYTLNNALVSWYNDTEGETEKSILRRVMQMVVHAPTLTPLNEPLSLADMREMGGKPYWHIRLETGKGHWVILDRLVAANIQDYHYGERWIAYRRPPEESK